MQKVYLSKREWRQSRVHFFAQQNHTQCCQSPIYGLDLRAAVSCWVPLGSCRGASWSHAPDALIHAIKPYVQRSQECETMLKVFLCHIPKVGVLIVCCSMEFLNIILIVHCIINAPNHIAFRDSIVLLISHSEGN